MKIEVEKRMSQKDVIDIIKSRTDYNKKDIKVVFNVLYDIMIENMAMSTYDEPSEMLLFPGWKIGAKRVPERVWREPRGGTTLAPEKVLPYCKFQPSFRDKINNIELYEDEDFDEGDFSEDDE